MDILGIARTGLTANMARMTASASTIAQAGAGDAPAPQASVADALVEQLDARIGAEANLKMIATVSGLERRSIELWG